MCRISVGLNEALAPFPSMIGAGSGPLLLDNGARMRAVMSSWEISGTYLGSCNCPLICPCPVDGVPTGPNNECNAVYVFHVANGHFDDTDLSDVDFAFCSWFPSNLSAGGWKMGVVICDGVPEAQAAAVETILHGDAGGLFADLSAFYGEWLGIERVTITFSDGGTPSAAVRERANFSFEPLRGQDGGVTTIRNAMFGFTPEYRIGRATGRSDLFGLGFVGVYGETSDFTFSSEAAEDTVKARA